MTLNFIGFINDNCALATDKKVIMLDDFCAQYGYQDHIEGPDGKMMPNPMSRRDFANQKIRNYIVEVVNAHRVAVARAAVVHETFEL